MRRFWNWVKNEADDERTLCLEGAISEESWWGDEITPKMFKDELNSGAGPVTVWINSPGGDVFAAAQIYNALKEYPGPVTVKIDGIAASAASVIAMVGSTVYMSPVSTMMIHNPVTFAIGDAEEMSRAKEMLDEVKESIINAYAIKTGLSRTRLAHLMDAESWMNAYKAVELGFADKVLYIEGATARNQAEGMVFSRMAVTNSLIDKLGAKKPPISPTGTSIETLDKRLSLILH